MKLHYLAASASVLFGLASFACSAPDDDIVMGSDSGGSAGSHASGGSGSASGGKSSGGSSSGGTSSNGGEPSAGAATGGSASGGAATGGAASGGAATGGAASGGAAGGPSTSCEQDTDCTPCSYPTAPATAQQCYCITGCEPAALSKTQCSANQKEFEKVCANVHLPCPAIKCLPPADPVCKSHMCAAK